MAIDTSEGVIRLYGTGENNAIEFYPDSTATTPSAVIYLQADGTLNIGVSEDSGTTTVRGLEVHDISGSAHSGTLINSQMPQVLLLDGSREMDSDLDMGTNDITDVGNVDGVDVSDHSARHESGGADAVDHDSLTGFVANEHVDHSGVVLSVSGLGLSGGGDITSSRTITLASSSNPGAAASILATDATGALTLSKFGAANITAHLVPESGDTYDLGSVSKLWRKGWLSEMEAVLFVEDTVSAIGGWFMIPHGQGALAEDVDNSQTTIDFGQSMTASDFVLLRGIGSGGAQVEYLEIGSNVSGTTYNVTRDKDGSGANAWPEGHVFIVLGNSGDGRIELDAQTGGPRISIYEQGTTYNGGSERVRIGYVGDLTGLSGYGWCVGDPSGSEYAYYTDTQGMVIRGTLRADDGYLGALSIDGVLSLGSSGGIYQGTGSFASPTTGMKIWNDGGVGRIAGYNAGTAQWYAGTDGKLYAAGGKIIMDANNYISCYDDAPTPNLVGKIGFSIGAGLDPDTLYLDSEATAAISASNKVYLEDDTNYFVLSGGTLNLQDALTGIVNKYFKVDGATGDTHILGDLTVGSVTNDPNIYPAVVSEYLNLPCLRGFWGGAAGSSGWIDLSGNGNHLTINGNPTINQTSDGAPYWDFDGTGDYASHTDCTDFDITGTNTSVAAAIRGMTLGAWVNFDAAASSDEYIMSKFLTTGNQRSYLLQRTSAGYLASYISNDGSALVGVSTPGTVSASTWHFVTMCYKPSTSLNVWINDTETTNTTSIPASIYNSSSIFEISGINAGTYGLMTGNVAFPFICACALSDTQIERLYNVSRSMFGV